MEHAHLIIFVCLLTPLSMMLFIFKKQSRAALGFLIIGLFMCLFAGEINSLIQKGSGWSNYLMTTNITPFVEEVLKAAPILFTALMFKPDRRFLLENSIASGVGFATMENACLMFDQASSLSAVSLIARGFGAGMMHGISTLAVGYYMTFVTTNKKLSCTGTIAALAAASIYHSIYNIIVQSSYPVLGILLPTVTYIPLIIILNKNKVSFFGNDSYK